MKTESERRRGVARRAATAGAVGVVAAALVLGGGVPAWGAGAQSYTQVAHGIDQLDPDFGPNPCNGDPVTGTQRENLINHVTVKDDEVWATFTEEAWVDLTDTSAGGPAITYSGHFTAWGNYNLNQQNQTSTFTFNAKLVGSDGSVITGHEVTQFVLGPDGTVRVDFDKALLSCASAG